VGQLLDAIGRDGGLVVQAAMGVSMAEFGAGPRPVIEKALAGLGVEVWLPTLSAMVGAVRPMVVDPG
jgi:hypothetical protein